MSLRSRCAIAVAAGTLACAAVATPAVANDDWDPQGGTGHHQNDDGDPQDGTGHHQDDPRLSRGRVTADSLALRTAPNRGSQIIRFAHRGDIVSIFCKTGGTRAGGDSLWYLLTDGTWAWGPARHIDTIGRAPRWC